MTVLGPFQGLHGGPWEAPPLRVESADLDAALETVAPALAIPLPRELWAAGRIEIHPKRFKGFHPDRLLRDQPDLRALWEEGRSHARRPQRPAEGEGSRSGAPAALVAVPRSAIDNILDMVALPGESAAAAPAAVPAGGAADGLVQVLAGVFNDPDFRAVEAAWRGLRALLKQVRPGEGAVVEIVPAAFENLEESLDRLVPHVVADPPGIVLCGLEFDATPRSLELLERLAQLGETLMVPVAAAIGPGFFGLADWQELPRLAFLPHHLEGPAYAKWRRLRRSSAGRWLSLYCNRFLGRDPYGKNNPLRSAAFTEAIAPWLSPIWAVGALLARSRTGTGWPTRFAGGRSRCIDNLPLIAAGTGRPRPTEAVFDPDRVDQLLRSGITPLCAEPERDCVWVAAEVTAGGPALAYQLLVSIVARLLLECRENCGGGGAPAGVEAEIRRAFASTWEATGHPPPAGLSLEIGAPAEDGRIPVKVALDPSAEILPAGTRVEMAFSW